MGTERKWREEAQFWRRRCRELERERAAQKPVDPIALIEAMGRVLNPVQAVVEPLDIYGGPEKEHNSGWVPDPAWEIPDIDPNRMVTPDSWDLTEEREAMEGGPV